jgi:hypothetical protein
MPAEPPPALAAEVPGLVAAALPPGAALRLRGTGGFRLSDGGWAVCGEVRWRNAFGLTAGWRPFYLRFAPHGGGWRLVRRIVDWPADAACRRLAAGAAIRTAD